MGGSVGAGVVDAGVEGTGKLNKIYGKDVRAPPVGGTVVGVVSGLGAASLGVTE